MKSRTTMLPDENIAYTTCACIFMDVHHLLNGKDLFQTTYSAARVTRAHFTHENG